MPTATQSKKLSYLTEWCDRLTKERLEFIHTVRQELKANGVPYMAAVSMLYSVGTKP